MKNILKFQSFLILTLLFSNSVYLMAGDAVNAKNKAENQEKVEKQLPPLIPRWAYEPWVWEDNDNTQSSVLGLVDGYLSRNIPVAAVIIDSPWSTGYNDFNWDKKRYPEPQKMIDQLHDDGVRVIMWMTGNINSTSSDVPLSKSANYDFAMEKGYGLINPENYHWWKGDGLHIDVTNSEACQWFASELDKIMDMGIDGFKCDAGIGDILPVDPVTTSTGEVSHEEYKGLWHKYMYEYTVNKKPDAVVTARPYSHQHGDWHAKVGDCILGWSGDFTGDFDGISHQMDNLYRSAQAGYSGLQVEVGGYWRAASSKNELIRYAQFGAMMPNMSNGGSNGGLTNHLPWWHDQQNGGTETTDIYRYYATLHSELVPFLFSLGVEAHLTGKPIVRQADIKLAQHMLGDDIFVGVMTHDSDKALTLPEGQWIDFWNREVVIAGNQKLELTLPLGRYPIYFRSGAIIPMNVKNDITGHGDGSIEEKTTLLIFPNGKNHKTFYRPVGDGLEYKTVNVIADADNGTIYVDGDVSHDWILRIQVSAPPVSVRGADKWVYDKANNVIIIHKTGIDFEVTIEGLSNCSPYQAHKLI